MQRTSSNAWNIEEFKNFLEGFPLYVKFRTAFPLGFHGMIPQTLRIHCQICGGPRTFRDDGTAEQPEVMKDQQGGDEYVRSKRIAAQSNPTTQSRSVGGDGLKPPSPSGIYPIRFKCQDCLKMQFRCWVEVSDSGGYVQKVGQFPPWLGPGPKEIEKEFGADAELYKKALRNMSQGYGIGACAYLRRLLEQYINPLLQLLYEVKEDQGVSEEELEAIKSAITAKNFTEKTKYASEIAPASIRPDGHNPLKEIHDRLSDAIHNLDEETAIEYALTICTNLVYIVSVLRHQLSDRKQFAEGLKEISKLKGKRKT